MSETVQTVPCDAGVSCSVTVPITANCPVIDETDAYDVTVSWDSDTRTLEKHDLRQEILSFDGNSATQEQICATLYTRVTADGVDNVTVVVQDTKHMDMVVEK